jgi:hypothetical protein
LLFQAAYQEVDPVQRPELHLQVGRRLMAGLSAAQYEDNQYSILHHFNEAIQLITDTAERLKLAKANMAAGTVWNEGPCPIQRVLLVSSAYYLLSWDNGTNLCDVLRFRATVN